MDIQLLLVFILALLTVSLVSVCVYVILVLREFKNTILKVNKALDAVEHIKQTISNPTNFFVNMLGAVTETIKAVKSVRSIVDYSEDDDE